MASLSTLQNAIDTLLNHPLGANNYALANNTAPKAYEAYIFGLCLRAVRSLGATPVLRGVSGPPNPFVFRGAPGQIHSTHRNYGYAEFTLGADAFEIHAGVEFVGTSRVTHEFDVAIMKGLEAQRCRSAPAEPRSASVIAGWECKFYSATLGKALGRQFLGLVGDFGRNLRLKGLCSNSTSDQLKIFFSGQNRPYPHFNLTPLSPDNENQFVGNIVSEFRKLTAS